ncbi:MAG: response regulator [Proteobacteria bacterium]|nr:response regulator [Pseudomonadota bacterium]MBU1057210.1 response regulator [Pseudomonadota bacterium]
MDFTSFFPPACIAAIRKHLFITSTFDEDAVRKTGLMYGIVSIGIFFLSLLGAIAFMQGGLVLATLDFLVALILFGILFFLRLKGYLIFCIYTGIAVMYCLYLYLFIDGGISGTAFLWSYTFPLFAFFLLGSKKGLLVSVLFFISCLVVMIVDLNSSMINLYSKDLVLRFIPSFAAVLLFALVYEKFRESSQRALVESANTLEKKVVERTEELRINEARYRTLYDNAGDGISIINAEGHYLSANKQFCNRLGLSEDELKARTIIDIYMDSEGGGISAMLQEVLRSGSVQFETTQRARSGELFSVEVRAQRIVLDNEIAILCSCHDIGERKRQEQEKKVLQEQLFRASKMEAIGLMAGGVAHDLNNILTGITGYPELLLLQLSEESELRKPIEEIKKSGERAAAVVADLLTVARGVASIKKVSSLNTLIREYLDSPEHRHIFSLCPQVQCLQNLAENLPDISCSPVHIKKCIMNLVMNAAEAIGKSGDIVLKTSSIIPDPQWAKEHELAEKEYVVLTITDTGPGIPKTCIEHIFEPFYTKKAMGRSGTGLGLAVVWNTMIDHAGKIFVESSDKGTRFQLYFPVATETDVVQREKVLIEKIDGNGESILVVDDEPQLRDIAAQMLGSLGYLVDSVDSGESAVEFVKKQAVDLIVIDMLMEPGMNGRQAYEEILERYPGQRAIIASGFSESDDVQMTLQRGAGGFIKKPYSIVQLGRAVKEALAS